MTRREERESLFALLFEMSFSELTAAEDVLAIEKEERSYDTEYIINSYHGILSALTDIDGLIEKSANGWKLSRLSRVTHAILRVAVYEMVFNNLPVTIAINEAVELAKKYDHEKAPAFVNGILNRIADEKQLKDKKK